MGFSSPIRATRRTLEAGALALFGALALTCGGSSSNTLPDDAGFPSGSTGVGSTGSTGVGSGSTGSSTTGSTGTGGGASFEGIWKRASAKVAVIDTMNPLGAMAPSEVQIPTTLPLPADGREIDLYQQIANDKLVTFAYLAGAPGYYRIEQPLTYTGGSYSLSIPGSAGNHIFEMKDGHLVDTVFLQLGTKLVTSDATFIKYDGPFPPSTWPAQVVVLP